MTNLRKIWNQKKHEMQITQIEAAKALGWTQGAFSQYLNNITELGPSAVVKLANFLGVDPTEIDPDLHNHLPNVRKVDVRFAFDDAETMLDERAAIDTHLNTFFIHVTKAPKTKYLLAPGTMLQVCRDDDNQYIPHIGNVENPFRVIQRRGSSEFEIVLTSDLPKASTIKKNYLLLGAFYY